MELFNNRETYTAYNELASIWITTATSIKLDETSHLLNKFISTTFFVTSCDDGLHITANTEWTDVTTAYAEYIDIENDSLIQPPDVTTVEQYSSDGEILILHTQIKNAQEAINWSENIFDLVLQKARFLKTSLKWLEKYHQKLSELDLLDSNNSKDNRPFHSDDQQKNDSLNIDNFDD
jgi:hypothetical protein